MIQLSSLSIPLILLPILAQSTHKVSRSLADAPAVKAPAEPVSKNEERSIKGDVRAVDPAPSRLGLGVRTMASPFVDRSRVFVSRPDDGRIWAHGADWKASFGTEGATHIPFFGSDAPRNYPLSFSIERISSGGQAVAIDSDAQPALSGETVTFDRGGVVERYDLAPDAIEQSFVFGSLPSAGDLVLRIAVATDLSRFSAASGLEFSNELGKVTYGKATVVDAAGRSSEVETSFVSGSGASAIELTVPAAFVAGATLPITVDPVVRVFTVFHSPTYSTLKSDAAYDATNDRYLVVFEEAFSSTDHDVISALLDSQGGTIIDLYVDTASEYWAEPRVANNNLADQFLVVAMVSNTSGSPPWIIRGATEYAATATLSAPFTISGGEGGSKMSPDVGGDPVLVPPTYYCVVWHTNLSPTDSDIRYQLVGPDRTLHFGGTQVIDNTSGTVDIFPRVSKSDGVEPFSTQRWNVVWTRAFSSSDADVRGAQIDWDGTVVSPSFSIDNSTNDDLGPSASSLHDGISGERDWIVAFQRRVGGDSDIVGYALNGSSKVTPLTSFSLLESLGGSGTYTEDQILAAADCDGSKFAIAYSESAMGSSFNFEPCIASFDLVGTTLRLTEAHNQPASSPDQETSPSLVSQHGSGGPAGRFAMTWTQFTSSYFGVINAAFYDAPRFQSFCFPGRDSMACPCGNAPSGTGRGCQNSAGTGGARLWADGLPESDTVVLTATDMKPSSACIFFQGNAVNTTGLAYGDGVRCAAGTIKRLYVKSASTGTAAAPSGADPSIRTRSAALGDTIQPGTTRWYQTYYRDPASFGCAFPSTFNTTPGIIVDW